jgi:hypothetical protein
MIFHKSGQRELFNLIDDLSESEDKHAANPEIAAKLVALMQSSIDRGRSTPGAVQKNEHPLSLSETGDRRDKRKRKQL